MRADKLIRFAASDRRAALYLVVSTFLMQLFTGYQNLTAGENPNHKTPVKTKPTLGHRYIMIDQFGYRPKDPKIAVIVDPQRGYNANDHFDFATKYEVRRAQDGKVVYSGETKPFNNGAIQLSSGDRGHWFQFTNVSETGSFYLYDTKNNAKSHVFKINEHVYGDVLKAAVRMFYYNRSGIFKRPPHADRRWTDKPAYIGPGQDGEARAVDKKNDAESARDLRGGWFDAGDTNKYINNAGLAVHQLLAAYREAPGIWGDNFEIPESGNGIPDLLDEILWELDWFERMQEVDGGVLAKVGTIDWSKVSPPGKDRRARYYVPSCSSSTITAAGIYAHAASVFDKVSALSDRSTQLRQRAERAWHWYHANPKNDNCDNREVKSGDSDRSLQNQAAEAVVAAIYLLASTGKPSYEKYIQENYKTLRPLRDTGWSLYDAQQGEALLFYTKLPNADSKLRTKILQLKQRDTEKTRGAKVYSNALRLACYRAYIFDSAYHWGSNRVRANYGNSNLDVITYGLAGARAPEYRARALGLLHYFHGVNPQGMVYLSNMGDYGAEVSVSEMYHTWFHIGTPWFSSKKSNHGPAPGYVVSGPNAKYSGKLSPPAGQPLQKSYRDWTGDWREKPWEVTEPSIVNQSAYIKLLSKFITPQKSSVK